MSKAYIAKAIRERIAIQARRRCLLHDIILRQRAKRALFVEDTRLGWRSAGQAPMLLVGIRTGTDSLKHEQRRFRTSPTIQPIPGI